MGRVLGRLRLSVASDQSTSIERQQEAVQTWADQNGHTVVGWAQDIDVSGSTSPFDTPGLGPWFGERADEWDVLAAWKLDRLGRNALQLNRLFVWCQEHDKSLVSCSESIDLGNWTGRMLAGVIAGLAEGELEAIRERQLSSRRKLRETARWGGGRPPYGYRPVDNPAGPGKVLEIDREAHAVVRRIVEAFVDGVPMVRIARELNDEGVRPPADHYRLSVGKPDKGGTWNPGAIRKMLRSPTLLGHAHLSGVTVRDDHGQPVRMGEPLVSEDERGLIVAELDRLQSGPRERRESGPLAGILSCYFCGSPLSQTRHTKGDRPYRYYRCHVNSCGPMIPAEDAETIAEEQFLGDLGSREVTERVWVPGDNRETELKGAVAAFDELSATAGVLTSRTARDRLQRQLAALDARIAELESTPAREGRWEQRPTGEKYAEVWERYADDPEARRELLKRSGITIRMGISGVGRRTRSTGGAWHTEIFSPAEPTPEDAERARQYRLRWGVPD